MASSKSTNPRSREPASGWLKWSVLKEISTGRLVLRVRDQNQHGPFLSGKKKTDKLIAAFGKKQGIFLGKNSGKQFRVFTRTFMVLKERSVKRNDTKCASFVAKSVAWFLILCVRGAVWNACTRSFQLKEKRRFFV